MGDSRAMGHATQSEFSDETPEPREGVTSPREVRIARASPEIAKIALFRSLFRGRNDIYARRFESLKTGRSGYAPACVNE